ncbi:hypothetical protein AZI87_13895 [Bdellovibrio bacteriovorus]|uniref:Uncharacterized protein n=1 Tax=Bdellovibrio bacteriovorus TaxID=959 RepID=A0A162G4L2_BDEBC|nr:hypothetical protein [Bdellovibrio bacteriovorus]KYG64321.1 hypothetical protein AZI87_13895 [Bdellovibrio bacteriovorus]
MIEKMTHDDLLRLTSVQDGPCISIYIPAMPSKTLQMEYEALVRRAVHLLSYDQRKERHQELLDALYNFNPAEFLESEKEGLAIFVNKHWTGYYVAGHELPSKVVVAESFHLKPLIEDLQGHNTYHALVLTPSEAVLFSCDGSRGSEIHTFLYHHGQHSNSMHWKYQDETETFQIPHLKSHSRGRGTQDNHLKKKSSGKLFLKWIESKISKETGYKTLPLFVFTSDIIFHAYKEVSAHAEPVLCKVDPTKGIPRIEAITHQANLHIQKNQSQQRNVSTMDIDEMARQKRVIDDLVKISRAALGGKVRTLFIRDNSEIWGQLHRGSAEITFHEKQQDAKDDDILDDIACEVIRHGGEVIVLNDKDMPTSSPAAAILNLQ